MAEKTPLLMTVGILGGTGKEGSGLAMRWALSGYTVIIGSRDAARAEARAAELNAIIGGDYIKGMNNEDAARISNLVVLSVPYDAHRTTLEAVRAHLVGKILLDITVPLAPPRVHIVHVPDNISPALEAQAFLGSDVRVVAGFHNVSAEKLKDPYGEVDCDVLIFGDDATAKSDVIHLAEAAHLRGIDAGPLANAVAAEALTSVLIYINKTYKVKGAGIRITGID